MLPNKTAVIVLAAGKGTRLGCTDRPKVMLELAGKPMVAYTVETLEKLGLSPANIVLVVGFCHEVVENYFGNRVTYALQSEQLGTAHATMVGIKKLSPEITNIIVMGGDDSAFYRPETLVKLAEEHISSGATATLLTVEVPEPGAYGRVIREQDTVRVIEKEYTTEAQKQIKEVSTGTYCFDRIWFETMYPNLPILERLKEWVLPVAFAEVRKQGLKQGVVCMSDPNEWYGVNTPEELTEANRRKENN